MIYKWKPGAVAKIDAQKAGEELERIRVAHNGRLTQDDVVTAARAAGSPLHGAFEWNDQKAAHEHRLQQASYIIRSITIAPEDDEEAVPIRAFVNVEREADRSYTSTQHALSDAELRAQVLARALKELDDWQRRYNDLAEFAKLFAAVQKERRRLAA